MSIEVHTPALKGSSRRVIYETLARRPSGTPTEGQTPRRVVLAPIGTITTVQTTELTESLNTVGTETKEEILTVREG